MRLVVVRHGDTEIKVGECVQEIDNPLSETGKLQAERVVKDLVLFNIDLIVSSPLPRARDTAIIINEALQKELCFNGLLTEVKWPSALEGKKLDDPKVVEYRNLRNEKNNSDVSWHYSDEENFEDIKNRAIKLLAWLKELRGENILVVTHSTFLKVVVSVMCHGDKLTWPIYYDFLTFTRPKHTSISTFNLSDKGKWNLDTWNMLNE
ncbi:histidine phosphatase family protein [Candidatus Collierbacteria bacterium]|nr:histidine phosphatase family protein [Candidatus Collierbacteria bacterium]